MAEPGATTPPPTAAPARDVLLATKLHIPRPRAGFLSRPRLLELLAAGATRELTLVCAPPRFGKTTLLGWIHHEDAAAATVAALEQGRPGQAYNLVDDLPATWQEVFTTMARAFGTPPPRRLPRWLFRLAAPYVASFAVDTSMRVTNAKARAELGWRPAFRPTATASGPWSRASADPGRSAGGPRPTGRGPPRG